ncbi:MAG TPA: hypothetical protein ENK48_07430 [Gammaproteobacteria bacterium]|nr:hypothetical protein [Gammaproteobacteria bacterium]
MLFAALLLWALAFPAHAAWWNILPEDLNLSGYIKNETAYRVREPRSFTKIRNILYLNANYPLASFAEFTAAGWTYYDLVYDLFDYDVITARSERDIDQPLNFVEGLPEEKDSPVAEFRELFLDLFLGNFDVRIGKQFVVWGVLTGVRVVDEINPMDFRELILPDLLDYRIPLWTLKVDYYGENNTYEFLVIPELEFHKPAPPGSEWELLQKVPGTTFPDDWTLENTEVGFKVSRTLWDTELSLSYFYTWDDFPVIFRRVRSDQIQEDPQFFPRYTRIHMYGLTFQRGFFGQILKGEFAFVKDKYFGIENTFDQDGDGYVDHNGELKRDHIRWGLGLDFNLWKTDFSPGIVQWVILDYEDAIIQDEYDTSFNLFVRKELPQHSAVFEMLGIWPINLQELYANPEITFNVTEQFQVAAGLDLFWGDASATGIAVVAGRATEIVDVEQKFRFFGNFDQNDRVYMEFKYSF